jgi:hypothetical protein
MSVKDLRQNPMMCHLIDSLEAGKDVGHYGRLVFAMVARHFLSENELTAWLCKSPDFPEDEARALVMQVQGHDYSPPRPEKIMEWQSQQEFPICPNHDRDSCNVYHNLKFPDGVYHHITEYYEQKAQ